jgi:hypothetical protein
VAPSPPSNPADLIPSPLQQLSVGDVADLAARFAAVAMDADLRTVANAFAEAVMHSRSAPVIEQRWHHLLMTAGNFKRQAPINLGFQLQPVAPVPCPPFLLPGGPPSLPMITSTCGYEALDDITGIGVPTATTILSVLWPDEHLIVDRFDIYATVGLALARRSGPVPQAALKAWTQGTISWGDYEWFRSTVNQTRRRFHPGDVSLLHLEKALFQLYQLVPPATRKSDQWAPFVVDLGRVLQRCPGCNVFGFEQHDTACASARCNIHHVPYGTNPCRHRSPDRPAWQWRP